MISQLQIWTALIGGLAGLLLLIVSNVYALTRFFSKMTSRFDVLNAEVSSLKMEFRSDIDKLGDRLEGAVESIGANAVSGGRLEVRCDDLDRRLVKLEQGVL